MRRRVSGQFGASLLGMTSALRASTRTRSKTGAWFATAGAAVIFAGLILCGVAASLTATAELIGEFGGLQDAPDVSSAISLEQFGVGALLVGGALVAVALAAKLFRF